VLQGEWWHVSLCSESYSRWIESWVPDRPHGSEWPPGGSDFSCSSHAGERGAGPAFATCLELGPSAPLQLKRMRDGCPAVDPGTGTGQVPKSRHRQPGFQSGLCTTQPPPPMPLPPAGRCWVGKCSPEAALLQPLGLARKEAGRSHVTRPLVGPPWQPEAFVLGYGHVAVRIWGCSSPPQLDVCVSFPGRCLASNHSGCGISFGG
jgi:hypothetical protein